MCDFTTFVKGLTSAGLVHYIQPFGGAQWVLVGGITYEFGKDGSFLRSDIDEGLQ